MEETNGKWNARPTSSEEFQVEFAVLQMCNERYLCKCSSVSNWLYDTNDWKGGQKIEFYADKHKKKRDRYDNPLEVTCFELTKGARENMAQKGPEHVGRLKPSLVHPERVDYIIDTFKMILWKLRDEDMERLVEALRK